MKTKLKSYCNQNLIEAGCDEAGRGCLAGPVFAAAVILPKNFEHNLLNDSKKLTDKQRRELRPLIIKNAVSYAVAQVDNGEIDKLNILNASIKAMQKAVERLKIKPAHLIIDGNRFHKYKIPHTCIIKGDAKYYSIAAASILAKTTRDKHIRKIAYDLEKKMSIPLGSGYPADPITKKFLETWLTKYDELPSHVRHSWKTAQKLINKSKTKKLDDF